MATLSDFLTGSAAFSTSLFGTPGEQRSRAVQQEQLDEQVRQFNELTAERKAQLAEQTRQHDLQYGEQTWTDPATGKVYKAARNLLPAIVAKVLAEPKYPTVGELQDIGLLKLPPVVKNAVGPERGEFGSPEMSEPYTGPITATVPDLTGEAARRQKTVHPETVNYLRTEATEQGKREREQKQNEANAKWQMYTDAAVAAGTPIEAARAAAQGKVFQETGLYATTQHVPTGTKPEPQERTENAEQTRLRIGAIPVGQRTPEQQLQYDEAVKITQQQHPGPNPLHEQMDQIRLRLLQEKEDEAKAIRDLDTAMANGTLSAEMATRLAQRFTGSVDKFEAARDAATQAGKETDALDYAEASRLALQTAAKLHRYAKSGKRPSFVQGESPEARVNQKFFGGR